MTPRLLGQAEPSLLVHISSPCWQVMLSHKFLFLLNLIHENYAEKVVGQGGQRERGKPVRG